MALHIIVVSGEDQEDVLSKIALALGESLIELRPLKTVKTMTGLNLRETPKVGKVLAQIPEGTTLLVKEDKDGWIKVSWKDLQGWISGSYVK